MIQYSLDALSNSAGELKVRARNKKEGGMIHSIALVILKMVLVCLALSVVALLVALLIPLKVAVQELIKEFGLKKTTAVAIMALVLLPIATAHAGDTIARIEDGNLVYFLVSLFALYGFIAAYFDNPITILFAEVSVVLFVIVDIEIFSGAELLWAVAASILLLIGYSLGLYLRRRREKRQNAKQGLATEQTT